MTFTDRVVVITGGTSGIGEATARLFVEQDATQPKFACQRARRQPGGTGAENGQVKVMR